MEPIICKNDAQIVIERIQEFLQSGRIIKDLITVDSSKNQIIIMISDKSINSDSAKIWWNGYSAGLKSALE